MGSPFFHGRDPELGAALRRALEPGDEAAFVARVRGALATVRPRTWDVLEQWAGRGLVAAALAVLAAGLVVARTGRDAAGLDEAFAAAFADSAVAFAAETPPDPSVVFATPGGR
ncbi:MAG TPA: hypothetical protein VD707_01395 [Gemmatimonadales bacterium]|nr:hypothetical protein [Gemmatimonadales bacterium]